MKLNVSLTDELGEFVESKMSTGRYTSASDVVREALRLMERHEQAEAAKLQWLQQAYRDGVASGNAGEIDFAAVKSEARAQAGDPVFQSLWC